MAVRSGSGTGVVVSLVVFVIITVCLLVLTIVFYSGQTDAREAQATAEAELAEYIEPSQRNNDQFKRLKSASGRKSVSMHLVDEYEQLMSFVDGNPKADLPGVQARAQGYGIEATDSLLGGLAAMDRDLRNKESEIETKDNLLAQKDQQIDEINARMDALKNSHQQEIESLQSQISAYADEAQRYRTDFQDVVAEVQSTVDRIRRQYDDQIDELENEKDELNQEVYLLRGRVNQLQDAIAEKIQRQENPALLVDGPGHRHTQP